MARDLEGREEEGLSRQGACRIQGQSQRRFIPTTPSTKYSKDEVAIRREVC
jgi:hypothetical protein